VKEKRKIEKRMQMLGIDIAAFATGCGLKQQFIDGSPHPSPRPNCRRHHAARPHHHQLTCHAQLLQPQTTEGWQSAPLSAESFAAR
jgi:hypothetical protein